MALPESAHSLYNYLPETEPLQNTSSFLSAEPDSQLDGNQRTHTQLLESQYNARVAWENTRGLVSAGKAYAEKLFGVPTVVTGNLVSERTALSDEMLDQRMAEADTYWEKTLFPPMEINLLNYPVNAVTIFSNEQDTQPMPAVPIVRKRTEELSIASVVAEPVFLHGVHNEPTLEVPVLSGETPVSSRKLPPLPYYENLVPIGNDITKQPKKEIPIVKPTVEQPSWKDMVRNFLQKHGLVKEKKVK